MTEGLPCTHPGLVMEIEWCTADMAVFLEPYGLVEEATDKQKSNTYALVTNYTKEKQRREWERERVRKGREEGGTRKEEEGRGGEGGRKERGGGEEEWVFQLPCLPQSTQSFMIFPV